MKSESIPLLTLQNLTVRQEKIMIFKISLNPDRHDSNDR